jgi:Mn-dependent DtxR family transcriptional regulator
MRTDVEERILQYLAAIGVASTREITSVLGLSKKSAQIHLGDLSRAKLVNDCAKPRRLSVLEKQGLVEQSSRSWGLTDEGRKYIQTRGLASGSGPK